MHWSRQWKLTLNSTRSNNSYWQLVLYIGNNKIQVNYISCLLDIILDRSLTFNMHLKKSTAFLTSRLCILQAIVYSSWGWHCSAQKITFHALICSKLNYAAPAWKPWLFATNMLKTIFIIFKTMLLNSLLTSLYLHPWWSLAPGTWHL